MYGKGLMKQHRQPICLVKILKMCDFKLKRSK